MKGTKVYVEELPKSCGCCEFYSQDKYCAYCLMLNEKLRYIDKDKDCPLKSLHDHDKELVAKQVKTINGVLNHFNNKLKGAKFDERMIFIELQLLKKNIIETLQKEFEK